ncbi:peptidoglycan/xylan/chitin deacetylase (PgdA/CDA1 family) [Paenibacillus rhizosphaerae]|uniref:Peptidoglycan/xylan/chitin deacetylase (PgdA/CDA1 family) n=1 Tax=Paenibacillus rhizosphaerae TaxID=297318 RepID=A0A839TJA2_9BACL|nr:polysaccharide deacetylase family protein [Paenibacillus rhizosphaerae]MBB3126712.1 peptidoglycan/xylan/chitin deacetylase (PgdA/CDA1 family) [Paenibacillus rhizosphaerae]
MRIQLDRFPNGVNKAVTLSFDDGRDHDRKLVRLLNDYGLKGTFHLNSGNLGKAGYIDKTEVAVLFQGHEVSAHTVDHPFLEQTPPDQVLEQVVADRKALEELVNYPVKGMSYPFGTYSDQVVALLRSIGIEYARTVNSHGGFHKPEDWLRWHPTCHHKQMVEYADQWIHMQQRYPRMSLFYVWGHSYEFDNDNNWDLVERFGEMIGGKDDIWYATNAEIYAYCKALEGLRYAADSRLIHNPSAQSVWVSVDGDPIEVRSGEIVRL